jgi:hypothetical protein
MPTKLQSPLEQVEPHVPQWAGSDKSASHPLPKFPSQLPRFGRQGISHVPSVHVGTTPLTGQAVPQEPQFRGSYDKSKSSSLDPSQSSSNPLQISTRATQPASIEPSEPIVESGMASLLASRRPPSRTPPSPRPPSVAPPLFRESASSISPHPDAMRRTTAPKKIRTRRA